MTPTTGPTVVSRDALPLPLLLGGLLVVLLPACSGGPESGSPPGPWASCLVATAPENPGHEPSTPGGLPSPPPTFGLTRSVDPRHAPAPTNSDEAFLFGMLYQPLVRMDCAGRLHPGLAAAWEESAGGRRWTFTLRPDARFWDGEPVTARTVSESWRDSEAAGLEPWEPARPLSVEVLGDRRLRVTFSRPWSRPPSAMTGPALAVSRPAETDGWPRTGTGPYRPADPAAWVEPRSGNAGGDLALEPVLPSPADSSGSAEATDPDRFPGALLPEVRVRIRVGGDPRDLLDEGVDAVFAGDPRTLEYAALRSDLESRPLAWSRRYVLVPGAALPYAASGRRPPDSFLEGLARDVALEEARAATDPGCLIGPLPLPRSSDDGARIGYPREDPTARALAERIVALAAGSRAGNGTTRDALGSLGLDALPSSLVAVPVGEDAARFLETGEAARILGVARRPDPTCVEPPESSDLERDRRVVPLVDTRRRVISRAPSLLLVLDGAGTPVPVAAGPSEAAPGGAR